MHHFPFCKNADLSSSSSFIKQPSLLNLSDKIFRSWIEGLGFISAYPLDENNAPLAIMATKIQMGAHDLDGMTYLDKENRPAIILRTILMSQPFSSDAAVVE